jgi:methyltransferase (TIGR00027 family)
VPSKTKERIAETLAGNKIISEILPLVQKYEEQGKPLVAVRTRFFDDFLMSSASKIEQIVILGAGMDTRAFRLPLHRDTCLYEIDRPEVMQLKESLLPSTPGKCYRASISMDLKQKWFEKLVESGFQPSKTSIWLLEGLLYYLTEDDVRAVLKAISDLTSQGSRLGADLINKKMRHSNNGLSQYWQSDFDEPEKLFAEFGWQSSVVQYGDETASYGRFKYKFPPREVPDIARSFLLTAIKIN